MVQKGEVKTFIQLTKVQKADVRKRMKSPYAGYYYKIYNGKVSHRLRIKWSYQG